MTGKRLLFDRGTPFGRRAPAPRSRHDRNPAALINLIPLRFYLRNRRDISAKANADIWHVPCEPKRAIA
jgi:hypothetical protein